MEFQNSKNNLSECDFKKYKLQRMTEEQIDAYAKLQGEDRVWYVNNVPFVFGRKSEKSPEDFCDICMDVPDKTVSRKHAILTYSDELKSYILEVKGKQGCTVNKIETYIAKNEKCCLNDGDAVEIIKCKFYFLLPQESEYINKEDERKSEKRSAEAVDGETAAIEDISKKANTEENES